MKEFISVEQAIQDIKQGRIIILVDDENRENEGDVVIAAEKVTPEIINFMSQHARGQICLALHEDIVDHLRIPLMPERNRSPNQATFTASIEAVKGVTSGVSAKDRAHTIQVAVNPATNYQDITMPGHIFPLRARKGGVLERQGHTEASVDLAKLAGLQKAAVICEVLNKDGSMARLPELRIFAEQHKINLVSINDLISHRIRSENIVDEIASAILPLETSPDFKIKIFRDRFNLSEHIALIHNQIDLNKPCLVRIHSECLTGDAFGSRRCDCGWQLQSALNLAAKENGIVLYMRQEGRGIGLSNKIKAYQLQSHGLDTVAANQELGFLPDHRSYGLSAQILRALGVTKIRLMTNNPHKIEDLQRHGIEIIERIPLEAKANKENLHYLQTKRNKLGHLLELD